MAEGGAATNDAERMKRFNEQVIKFKRLGNATVGYMRCVQAMRASLKEYNAVILDFCKEDWPMYSNFKDILVDSEELYSLLENDIAQLGDGFKNFGDRFHMILNTREEKNRLQEELNNTKHYVKKVSSSSRSPTAERQKATQLLKEKETECQELEKVISKKMDSLYKSQKAFLREHYGSFINAHIDFCKDNLIVQDITTDCLKCLLPKKKGPVEPDD